MKKIYVIAYDHSNNIGDNIQSYTTKKILAGLGYEVREIDQNSLHIGIGEDITVFINGFFCFEDNNFDTNFPFHKSITPIFYNFHLELDYGKIGKVSNKFFTQENINYFKSHEPIGCRDQDTADIFSKFGIKSVNNECITLLLDKRTDEEEKNAQEIILVDVDSHVSLPKNLQDHKYLSHIIPHGPYICNHTKFSISEDILEYYKKNAKLIITSRFHCAMPCIAMGIPVIMLGENNSRLKQKYLKIYPYIHWSKRYIGLLRKAKLLNKLPIFNIKIKYSFTIADILYSIAYKIYLNFCYKLGFKKIDWSPQVIMLEQEKLNKINAIKKRLSGI